MIWTNTPLGGYASEVSDPVMFCDGTDAAYAYRSKKLTSTARDPTSTPRPVPSARPNTSPAPSVRSDPGMKHTVVKTYTAAKASAP